MRIAVLVGSLRKESYNKKIAEFMKDRYKEKVEFEILDIGNLPLYNQDEEFEPSQVVKEFKKKVLESDGVMISTPEYNHSIPGALKNAIDWLSRVNKEFTGKPTFIVGASGGLVGTARCQSHLRQVLVSPGVSANVLYGNEILIATVAEKFKDGVLIDQSTINHLDKVVENFIKFANKK